MKHQIKYSKGFTLIELLVVISIIGMMASVVMASLNVARDRARVAAGQRYDASMYRAYSASAIGIWNMDEGSGTSISDASGNSFNSTGFVGSPTWVTVEGRSGLQFDGVNSVSVPNISSLSNLVGSDGKMLFTAWIRPTNYNSSINFYFFATGFPMFAYSAIDVNRKLVTMVRLSSGTNEFPKSNLSIPLDKWTHIAILYEAGVGVKYYIDGKLDSAHSLNIIVHNFLYPTQIGNGTVGSGLSGFVGQMDSIRVYYPQI